MLGRVDVAGAEEAGEGGHAERHRQRHVGMERRRPEAEVEMIDERRHRGTDRLQLERDVGDDADQRDDQTTAARRWLCRSAAR